MDRNIDMMQEPVTARHSDKSEELNAGNPNTQNSLANPLNNIFSMLGIQDRNRQTNEYNAKDGKRDTTIEMTGILPGSSSRGRANPVVGAGGRPRSNTGRRARHKRKTPRRRTISTDMY